jgi:hypothetical protein
VNAIGETAGRAINGKLRTRLQDVVKKLAIKIFVFTFVAPLCAATLSITTQNAVTPRKQSAPIPMDELGAVAREQYQGDGLSVTATPDGAKLRCRFQQLEGLVTREGLWLSSTVDSSPSDRFRVVAVSIGRTAGLGFGELFARQDVSGIVKVTDKMIRFFRPGLTEEYSVSVDGVRQDFIIEQRPVGEGELRMDLDVTGAKAEPLVSGARLVLDNSGRKIAYNRLLVTDARGKELSARLQVTDASRMAVVVDDAKADYPLRVDPTFSDADWISMGEMMGANGAVRAAVVDAAGNLYVGGDFTIVGDAFANRVAKWDGSRWWALGSGVNSNVNALVVFQSNVYAAGSFATAGGNPAARIAKWDGTSWSPLGSGVNQAVQSLAVLGDFLFVGGSFTSAGGATRLRIARWDGINWSSAGSMNEDVNALAVSGNDLYAGATWPLPPTVYGVVSKWTGSSWSNLAVMNGSVQGLAVSGSNVWAGGSFSTVRSTISTNSAMRIAQWNGTGWSPMGSGLGATVYAIAEYQGNIYAGGDSEFSKWNRTNWTSVGGVGGRVQALAATAEHLYAGGDFLSAAGRSAHRIVGFQGTNWFALGSGFDDAISAIAFTETNLYVGGSFTMIGDVRVNRVAKWDGNAWSALGSGVDDRVSAIAIVETNLYVGGMFTFAGDQTVKRIAKWDGSGWSGLGSGINADFSSGVNALAVSGNDLYAGGDFSSAGGVGGTHGLAKWNGNSWTNVGIIDGYPYISALAVSGSNLYVGGSFKVWMAGTNYVGVHTTNIAKWDGVAWSNLEGGLSNSWVRALTVSGDDLYVGMSVTAITPFGRVAKWDGNTWTNIGSSFTSQPFVDSYVSALALAGSELYAAGRFANAAGIAANNIAKWDGAMWSQLGVGTDGVVGNLAVSNGELYVMGGFTSSGSQVSAYWAKANISGQPSPGRFRNLIYSPVTGFTCTFSEASVGQSYRIQTAPTLASGSWTDFTNFNYTGPIVITDASAGLSTNKFFRAVTP